MIRKFLMFLLLGSLSFVATAGLEEDIASLQHGWAEAFYTVPEDQKVGVFEMLATEASAAVEHNRGRAEPLVWQAIILSSYAKFEGGLDALGMVKRARDLLLEAEKIDPNTLDGSVYTSLGSLYAKVPRWPIAFGDKKKAREYLDKALALNPDGIDPHFFYGELLIEMDDRAGARRHLEKALAAPARPGREDADAGRRAEVKAVLGKLGST
ncbi:MAG: tetratricopeptide repeat protein [Panacagrimonas sp.]